MKGMSKDLFIIAAGFIAAMHIGKLPPAIPVLQQQLGISFIQSGLLLSLVQGAGMCFALLIGSYIQKIGFKLCILLGLSLLTIASAWGSFVQSFDVLLLLRVIEGFGFLLVTLTGPAFIRQLVPLQHISAKMGLWSAYMGGGMGIALLVAPFLIAQYGWSVVWLSFAMITAALLLCIAMFIPQPNVALNTTPIIGLIRDTLKHPAAWLLALIFGTYAGQWFALVGFLPMIYAQNQISAELAGALTASVAVANAVGTWGCGLLLQRGFQAKTLVQLGFAVLIICSLEFYLFKDALPFLLQYLTVFSFSLFGGLVAATVFAQALHFAPYPAAISTTIGMILQCSAISQFVLPPLIATVVSQTGAWFWAGILMSALSFVGIMLSRRLFQMQHGSI
ncbi:CynX/NimT family MFS transporter [Acinetobacter sp. YH12040]|uniref:MFS transporter n=1 Tax=Acinetobacter sp. YH12040 TaxID=2601048 RepID=UPI0015D1EFE0|nr:MFS transporter [Acinetobacter sp. YH12040]